MNTSDVVLEFYNRGFESKINENLLEYNYKFPEEKVFDYVTSVTEIPVDQFLDNYYSIGKDRNITSKDLLQFSSLEDATITICERYIEECNPGFSAEETGRLLLKNEQAKRLLAYRKYGENHAKAAEAFGLVYSITNVFFLSGLGLVYLQLSDKQREQLLTRMVLRTHEIEQLYRNYRQGKHTSAREYMNMLSDSTYRRRRSNLRRLIRVLSESREYDFSDFINSITVE